MRRTRGVGSSGREENKMIQLEAVSKPVMPSSPTLNPKNTSFTGLP